MCLLGYFKSSQVDSKNETPQLLSWTSECSSSRTKHPSLETKRITSWGDHRVKQEKEKTGLNIWLEKDRDLRRIKEKNLKVSLLS